jgi:hypothetical protein
MAYNRRLIHSCDLFRPTTTQSTSGQTKAVLPGTATTAAMPCLLDYASVHRVRKLFGADVECDAVVFFAFGSDVRPGLVATSGLNDRLKITNRLGVTHWLVVAVKEIDRARKGEVVAFVKRSAT